MLRLTITIGDGDAVIDHVLQGIQGIEERARDLRPLWPTVVADLQAMIAKAFASEGASTGAPWTALALATQADRARHGFGPTNPILERSGKLKRALTLGEGAFVSSTPSSMRYVVSEQVAPYFKFHQRGGPRLPRRAPVLLTAADKSALTGTIQLYITGRDRTARRASPR